MSRSTRKALIALEDGTCFEGIAFAGSGEAEGELIFNTSMTGYQEILTDPASRGQIVTLTYPTIGCYGVNEEDGESEKVQAAALLIGEYGRRPSNFRSTESLESYLERNGVLGIEGVDTRAITLHLREHGALYGVVSTADLDRESLVAKARQARERGANVDLTEDRVRAVSEWNPDGSEEAGRSIAVIDLGAKRSQLETLQAQGCNITLYPADSAAADILAKKPDGILLSDGAGNPTAFPESTLQLARDLAKSDIPLLGVGVGHLLLAVAHGCSIQKLKFGHHGAQPVKDLKTGLVDITTQSHEFYVDSTQLPTGVEVSHVNLNDQSCEGLRYPSPSVSSIQFDPGPVQELNPRPHPFVLLAQG